MAAEAPNSVDVTDYQFKVHDKFQVFDPSNDLKNDVDLLATSSAFGLVFVGNPFQPEIKILQLQKLVHATETGEDVHCRVFAIQGIPHNIACSSDGSLLAVNYTQNGTALLAIYEVVSFLSANVVTKNIFQVSADCNVQVLQILWNPVIATTFALVMSDGALSIYNLKDIAFEFYSIDKQEQAKCASWSPKGKQIVVGFPKGKLMQYKPDLKAARVIGCPPNVHEAPFNTIAIQWLSTYQFAAVFLQDGEDKSPSLYIINAPKTGQPTYINYFDICYSSTGPRKAQAFLTYIQQWNILLMATSNSMEVGVLGTNESGETPTWKQYVTPDEARIELPLTKDKQETYPIGFAFETGTTHQLVIAERQIPVMPMIHILSTHGLLVSFDFLNFSANAPDLCSPPRPIADTSGLTQFKPLSGVSNRSVPITNVGNQKPSQSATEVSFILPTGATSTPAQERKNKPLFGDNANGNNLFANLANQASPSVFGGTVAPKPAVASFGMTGGQQSTMTSNAPLQLAYGTQSTNQKPATPLFGGKSPFGTFGQSAQTTVIEPQNVVATLPSKETKMPEPNKPVFGTANNQNKDRSQPLYTVPPTFNPADNESDTKENLEQIATGPTVVTDNDAVKELTKICIQQFESELKDLANRSKNVDISIGNMDETNEVVKQLSELKELSNQAVESTESLATDIQSLRNSLNECFVMIAETKSKLNMYENPDLPDLATLSNNNQTNRRQIIKLKSLLATNEAQLQIVNQQIDAQWSNYQDMYRKSKTKMKIPSLEGVYQTLLKQKDILARERIKINYIKSRLGVKGMKEQWLANKNEVTIESLADSILSMSLSEQVKADQARLTDEKLTALRNILQNRKITIIKPQRPDRVGVNSEVVREMRLKMDRVVNIRDGASTKPEKMEKQRIKPDVPQIIAKPTPTKPTPIHATAQSFSTISQQQKPQEVQQPAQNKPSAAIVTAPQNNINIIKPTANTQGSKESAFPAFSLPSGGFSFGGNTPQKSQGIPFGGNTLSKPTAQLPFGANHTPQFSFTPKDDKAIIKPSPVLAPQATAGDEKSSKPTPVALFQKPLAVDKPTLGFSVPNTQEESNAIEVSENSEAPESTFTKPIPDTTAQPEIKPEEKTPTTFTAVTLSQSTGLGTGFSFGTTPNAGGTIFGGQGTLAKPSPSIFGGQLQTTPINSNPTATSTLPFAAPTSGFTALSFGLGQSSAATPSTTTATPASSFSFVNKSSADSTTQPTSTLSSFSFVGKTDTTPVGTTTATSSVTAIPEVAPPTVASTAGTPFGFNLQTTSSGLTLSAFSFASSAKSLSLPTTTTATTVESVSATSSADPTDSLFDTLNICKPSTQETPTTTATVKPLPVSLFSSNAFTCPTSPETKNLFGDSTSATPLFAPSSLASITTASSNTTASGPPNLTTSPASTFVFSTTANTSTTSTVAPVFASANAASSPTTQLFGTSVAATSPTSPPIFGSTIAATSAFAAPAPTVAGTTAPSFGSSSAAASFSFASTNVFGSGMPKPDQSVFGGATATSGSTVTPFGGAVQTTSPFGGTPATQPASGGNLFASSAGSTGFGMQPTSGGSIFGGGSNTPQSGLFGSQTQATTPTIFGGQTQQTPTSGGGFFGQTSFGGDNSQQSPPIFGGGSGNTSPIQPGVFSSNTGFGQQPFGGVQQQQQQASSSPFGSNTPFSGTAGGFGGGSAFGQTAGFGQSSPGGTFGQAAQSSVAQTGFGSPGFAKPGFGAPSAFGGTPAFGSPPTFGGAATFGSPKNTFGGFGQNTVTFSPPTQKSNLFESLGSSEASISFSNLAQTSSNAANAKQQFGGSSFSTWR